MPGKPIHQLRQKADVMKEVLFRAEQIEAATLGALAEAATISRPTLNYALNEGRLTVALEQKLCTLCGFDPDEVSWVDMSVVESVRADHATPNYPGRDTAEAFHTFLTQLWRKTTGPEAVSEGQSSADDTLLCHRVDMVKSQSGPARFDLLFQSDFGHRHHPASGICYAIRQARLDVAILGKSGTAVERLGYDEAFQCRDAEFVARGTDRRPGWDIKRSGNGPQPLKGIYSVRNPALARLESCGPGTRIETRMRVHFHEGFVIPAPGPTQVADNRLALIETVFANDFAGERQIDGWVQLSEHDLKIPGED